MLEPSRVPQVVPVNPGRGVAKQPRLGVSRLAPPLRSPASCTGRSRPGWIAGLPSPYDHSRMHAFSSAAEFSRHLVSMSHDPTLESARFPARNFRHEHALATERVASYVPDGDIELGSGAPRDQVAIWSEHHDSYVADNVRGGWRGEPFDVASPSTPETFRLRTDLDQYGHADDSVDLVRLEDVAYIATSAGTTVDAIMTIATRVAHERRATGGPPDGLARELDDVLFAWQESPRIDNRPMFACFWEDARETLEDPVGDWADDLRDRLGLAHHNPDKRGGQPEIPVIALRYPVRLVPRASPGNPRLLARPTVLDGRLSPSFFTCRPGSGRGSAIDLASRADEPWQEVVHPTVTFRAKHVWSCGRVTKPAPQPLGEPREMHRLVISEFADDDYRAFIDAIEDP